MKIAGLIAFILLLFSCNIDQHGLKTADEMSTYIQERYKTKSVSCRFGTDGKESYYSISVANSAEINKPESNPETVASDIALHLFDLLEEDDQKKYDRFTVEIKKTNHTTNTTNTTKFNYPLETILKVKENLRYMDAFLRSIEDKQYAAAESKFNTELVDTATFDLGNLFGHVNQNLGNLKRHELQGFEISESELNNKSYKILNVHYLSFYQEQSISSTYTLLLDEPNQKLINFLIN